MGRGQMIAAVLLVGACCIAGPTASADGPTAFTAAEQLKRVFDLESNSYEGTLFEALQQARTNCPAATSVPQNRRYVFEQEVDSTLRQLHDVTPFVRFSARVAALPEKPPPLAALVQLYLEEATVLKPLALRSPSSARGRATLICRLYSQWAQRRWSVRWINGLSMREYAAAHVPWNAAPRLARAAIALVPSLQRSGATHAQALNLTSVTLGFG